MDMGLQCYCGVTKIDQWMLKCQKCNKLFHTDCLKTGCPSTLQGDLFFTLTCLDCSVTGEEECDRMKIQWQQVVMLALYNLQLSGQGKCGYYRWKEHICAYIDKHWTTFFGFSRKKTTTWYGTVAGALSGGCPKYFRSGAPELKESGWWKLSENKPPIPDMGNSTAAKNAPKKPRLEVPPQKVIKTDGIRTRGVKSSFKAAMELKAKRAMTQEAKEIRRARRSTNSSGDESFGLLTPPTSTEASSTATLKGLDYSSDQSLLSRSDVESSLDETPTKIKNLNNSSFNLIADLTDQESQMSFSSTKSEQWWTEKDLIPGEKLPEFLLKDDEEEEMESDFEVDPCSITPPNNPSSPILLKPSTDNLPDVEDILSALGTGSNGHNSEFDQLVRESHNGQNVREMDTSNGDNTLHDEVTDLQTIQGAVITQETSCANIEFVSVSENLNTKLLTNSVNNKQLNEKTEDPSSDGESESESDSDEEQSDSESDQEETQHRKRKRRRESIELDEKEKQQEQKCIPITLYEEKQLLRKLKACSSTIDGDPVMCRLRRKLILRQTKRERGLPVFNLDVEMQKVLKGKIETLESLDGQGLHNKLNTFGVPSSKYGFGDFRVLDRFQATFHGLSAYQNPRVSFLNRLVGTDDEQLITIKSPYTARNLKPFIRRDFESRPLKMRLLQEIQAYPHKQNPEWESEGPFPIDYCYVRPQHIPSVNTLCRQFFWPGIDLSECLQYPDFSCVVLYRKFVIGFAFMVPDVKYNEAYISFVFTHPEWRGAGIGTFMIYHLIQTCMGKDVTLHVSASNPAMLLYQKFGFKPEEFILDFYDKYFPEDSKECKHAFFLRLSR